VSELTRHTASASREVPASIKTLVSQHAKAWAKAGQCNTAGVFDPYGGMWIESARDAEKRLLSAIAELLTDEDVAK
jgi:hypothetical protein